MLGLPPAWYKSMPYRSRAVIDPRAVLAEFGTAIPAATQVQVWDSTAEVRYLVIPMRPAGTEGWSEDRLAEIVTRNSMIGTETVKVPACAARMTLGGFNRFGPINPEVDEPVFHTEWEKRTFALNLAMGMTGSWNIDEARHARERLEPLQYWSSVR